MKKLNVLINLKSQNETTLMRACFTFLIFISPQIILAQSGGGGGGGSFSGGSKGGWSQRAQAREGSRWTLQDWLAQKQRNGLMDQWLMMNSPSPFEFYLLGASNAYQFQKDQLAKENHTTTSGAFGAYAQAVGLTGEYEHNLEEHLTDATGLLNFRILGSSLQTTSITLHIGQRTRSYLEGTQQESVRNMIGQISLQAYFTKYFGLQGMYRTYFPADHSTLGKVAGSLVEGGLFIDFRGLRVFGNWSDEIQINQATTGVRTNYKRQGIKTGLVIFF